MKKTKDNVMSKFVFQRATEKETHEPDRRSTTSTPLWVKVFGTIAIIVSLLFLSQMLGKIVGMDSMSHTGDMSGMSGMNDMNGMSGMSGMGGMASRSSRHLPLWIEVSGFSALVVVLLFFIAMLVGVGGNGRDRQPSGHQVYPLC
jgi:type VI protein secretion system component VasF